MMSGCNHHQYSLRATSTQYPRANGQAELARVAMVIQRDGLPARRLSTIPLLTELNEEQLR